MFLQEPGWPLASPKGMDPPRLDTGGVGWPEFSMKVHSRICVPCRRALYIITFLLFPINVLVGVLAGVWRVVISGLYNSVHLCRLDISLLHRGVETFDPGGAAPGHRATSGVPVPPWGVARGPGAAGIEGGLKLWKWDTWSW